MFFKILLLWQHPFKCIQCLKHVLWTQNPKVVCIGPNDQSYFIFGLFLPKFGCHGNAICSIKIGIAHFNLRTTITLLFAGKFLDFLHRTKFSAILVDFRLHLVAIATPLIPWAFRYYISIRRLIWLCYSHKKFLNILYRTVICVCFGLVLSKFGCQTEKFR